MAAATRHCWGMETLIKRCPFCNDIPSLETIRTNRLIPSMVSWRMYCACGASMACNVGAQHAIADWNKRVREPAEETEL